MPLRAPGLGGVFNQLQPALFSQARKGGEIGSLAVEMHRQKAADAGALRAIQDLFHRHGIQVEGGRIDVGQQRSGAGAQNRTDRGEKAEGGGDHRHPRADAGGGQRQPQGIGA